jgi:U2-associated protein SR140
MSSKKVPYHKHREAEEARKKVRVQVVFNLFCCIYCMLLFDFFSSCWHVKKEEEDAARVYVEFVESFKGDSSSGAKFVRGGVIDPNAKLKIDTGG